ncbi:MAG: hypothetical protein JWN44_2849 [Myxococcales bacterium]|nr:hypothetical protein [Myxococcales bacterium]
MSTILNTPITCPACENVFVAPIADSVGANRAPHLLDAVLAGTFHRFSCTRCHRAVQVEKEILFTDFARGHWIGVFPPEDEPRFQECGELVTSTFHEALVEKAPAFVATWAPRFTVRVVFGVPELREKLICLHNELDDRAIEILKLDLLADRPELVERGVVALRVDGVIAEDGAIAFVSRPFPDASIAAPPVAFLVPRDVYDAVLAALPALADAHAEMFAGPYVNVLRYLPRGAVPDRGSPRASVERRIWQPSRA